VVIFLYPREKSAVDGLQRGLETLQLPTGRLTEVNRAGRSVGPSSVS